MIGGDAVLEHVRRCWASLFTEEAVVYRLRNGIDHAAAEMAVVVQRMVPADAAGVMFTADPVSGNRTVTAIEAVAGLADGSSPGPCSRTATRSRGRRHRTHAGGLQGRSSRMPSWWSWPMSGGSLARELGGPQDIEWCLAGDAISVVQSRPITTLYPVPDPGDHERHVYVSVGHQQMMTDPMKPFGISVFQLTAGPQMHEAGNRLFVDVAPRLADPVARAAVIDALGTSDPLIGGALEEVVARGFIAERAGAADGLRPPTGTPPSAPLPTSGELVDELVANTEAAIDALSRELESRSGPDVFTFIADHIAAMRGDTFDPRSLQVIMAGMQAAWWLNDHLEQWLGERSVADTLAQSVPGNVTSEMGLALLDVADVVRPYPEVIAHLERDPGGGLAALPSLPGGAAVAAAIGAFLDRYGAGASARSTSPARAGRSSHPRSSR